MSKNNDDKPHSYTESAYKEGERCTSQICGDHSDHLRGEGRCEAKPVSAPSESQPDIFYGYLEEGVYGEFRHVPEPSPNKDKIGFIFGGKRYEFSRLAEPNKNKPESQESKDIDFLVWYSGMEREKILRAYKIYIREVVTRKPE